MNLVATPIKIMKLSFTLILIFSVSNFINAQISSFPYFYDFENENTGPTGCNPSYTMVEPGWFNSPADDMDWTNDINSTGSGSTGPTGDHTPNGVFYMYLETSCSAIRTANLETPVFDFTAAPSPQLSFWYHMYGASTGSLFFEVSTNGGGTWTSLWSLTGQQQTSSAAPWLQATVNLAAYGGNSNVRFRFRGVSSTNFTGDIGIDDFLVENILPNNAGISALVSPILGGAAGNYPVDVTLENFGSNTIDSVNVEWELAGVPQTSFLYTGPSLNAFTTTNVNLSASTNFPSGLTTLKFWTSNPNNVADADNGNDTLSTFFCTGLAGIYTVGTPTSDFPTINDALAALYGCGVSAPVTMQIQAGSYSTAININQPIPNISASNTVTFNGASKTAIITVSSGAAVTLDAIDHVTIEDFTLVNTSTTTGWGVLLTNAADFNTIRNNRIQMASTSSFNVAGIVASGSTSSVSSSGNNANYTLVENNEISGADRGISFYGISTVSAYNSGNKIRNNNISDADNYGIYTYYQDSLEISGNVIDEFPSTFHYGIYIYYTMNFDLVGNTVNSEDYGLYIGRANSQTTPARRALIANNMVTSTNDRAVYMFFPRDLDVYHNSFVSEASAIVLSSFDNTTDIKNNIFVSYSLTNYAFETFSGVALQGMDHNVFYKNPANPNLIDYGGFYTDLADWQANNTFGFGANSLQGLPQFTSATDLHVDGAFLNDMGVLTTVTTDIDGETRPAAGAASVDIGADEFTPPSNDAGVEDLASPTLPVSGGFATVEVSVRNYGISVLSAFDVEWEINGVAQAPVSYAGAPIAVNAATSMNLANINFPVNTTSLRFWTTLPNGVVDERFENDTLTLNICPGLAGNYTVGHSTSDFPTVSEAVDALLSCGVTAPVTMEFQPGTYTGPWVLTEIPGASAINTVTFDGVDASTTSVTHDGFGINTAATVTFDGVDHFIMKNFSILSTGLNTAYAVLFTNQANYNTLENNDIDVPISGLLTNVSAVVFSASYTSSTGSATEGNNGNWNIIKANDISGGVTGIVLEGGAANFENVGNQIMDNEIHDASAYGIYADEQDSLMISGNKVYDITAPTSDAMMLFDIHNFTIAGNEVNSNDYGIAIFGGFAVIDKVTNGRIYNNMVSSNTGGEAFYLRDANIHYIYHNTFRGYPAVYLDNHSNIDLRNNILSTANGFCFYTFDPVSMSAMDNNLYYISSASGTAVKFGSTNYLTLADWQATGPAGYDANSLSGNPNFINGLHVGGALPVDTADIGIVFPITTDFDGDVRPLGTKPDIGADEHVVIASDAMIVDLISPVGCGDNSQDIIVSLANVGSSLLVGLPITVNVSGSATATFNTNFPLLAAGLTTNVTMGNLNTAAGGTYNFEIIVSVGTDLNAANDTLRLTATIPPSNLNAISFSGDTLTCDGSIANISATANYAPATIHWYDAATGGNFLSVGNNYTTAPISGPTTYYAEVQGCNSPRASVSVNVDAVGIDVDLGADQTICGGIAVEIFPTITLSNASSFLWSDGSQSSFLEVQGAGTYIVAVSNANGCTDSDTIVITTSPTPNISNTFANVSCAGYGDGSINVSVSGGTGPYSYNWNNGATSEDLSSLSAGSYVVTISDNGTASSCSYIQFVEITEPTAINLNIDNVGYPCTGTDANIDITASGGSGSLNYAWSTGETSQNAVSAGSGSQSVTVTDANGCTISASTTVPSVTPINAAVDTVFDEFLALGGAINITASGGNGTLQYTWNTGATTDDISNLTAGTYSVTITDLATGCSFVLNNIVVEYKIPDAIKDIASLDYFKLYPNPTTDMVWVNMTLTEALPVQLEIVTVTGQLIQSFETREGVEQNYEINLSDFPSGVYLAKFIIGNEVLTTKIIVE